MSDEIMPSKLFVHLTFWGMHITLALMIASGAVVESESSSVGAIDIVIMFACIIFLFWYFFAIGRYASKLGRSGILWGGLSCLFSPLGVWVSYIASFFVGYKTKA